MAEIPLDDDDGSGSDSAAMMEAMGFTGFGMQRPTKKRKYDEQHHHDGAGVDAASGTGANTAPLGERRGTSGPALASGSSRSGLPARPGRKKIATGVGAGRDADEIDLDDDGDDDDDDQQEAGGDGADVEDRGAEESASGAGPQYIDTSRPSRGYLPEELEDMGMQAKIDAIMTAAVGGQSGYPNQHQQPQHRQHRQQQPPRHRPAHQQGGGDGRPWWEGYYDAKMNENPWEKLERERGLQPRGAWVARGAAAAAPGRADRAQAAAGGAAAAASRAPGEADEAAGGAEEKSAAPDAGGSAPAG